MFKITGSNNVKNTINAFGFNLNVPLPPEARPASGGDGSMVIISTDGRYAWDFFSAKS